MYPGEHAKTAPDRPAIVMARSGEVVTYRELDERSNRLAHLLRAAGLKRGDHFAVFMENHPRYVECCAAGERAGLYYTAANSFLTAGELAYILNNSLAKALINRPEVLLLDEPTASLDPDTGDLVRTWLERYRLESGCTIVLASHNMAEVERLCSDVVVLKK